MDSRSPSVACIGFIGRNNNPLHISLFPATGTGYESEREKLEYSFMLNSCLDIFEARMPTKGLTQDFGLLHALDERIAMYGWLTNTGVKVVVVVDMEGSPSEGGRMAAGLGLRNSDLTPVCFLHVSVSAMLRSARPSKHCRLHTFDCYGIHSTLLINTTQRSPEELDLYKSTVQASSKKLRGSAGAGIPALEQYESS